MSQKDSAFIVWSCSCGCGHVENIDVRKHGFVRKAAKEWTVVPPANRKVLLALVKHQAEGPIDLDRLRRILELEHGYFSTANAVHNRLSELTTWKLIDTIQVGEAGPRGTMYDYMKVRRSAYRASLERAAVIINAGWKTLALKALDGFTAA